MKEIKVSKEYLFSLITKIFVVLTVFWSTILIVLMLLESIGLSVEISRGQDNSIVIFTLFIITFLIGAIGAFAYYNLVEKRKILILEDKHITFKEGFIFTKEKKIPYSELNDTHCEDDYLAMIDRLFKIKILKIHGTETIYLPGILNGEEISKEIKINIEKNKEKKVDPITLLSDEIKNLKNEIAELKASVESIKIKTREKETKESKPKKKFTIGPFDEKIGE